MSQVDSKIKRSGLFINFILNISQVLSSLSNNITYSSLDC